MQHDLLPDHLDENDAPLRCTCTHTAGDAYYCRIHGGNGSWISLLRELVEKAEDGRPDETTRRTLREAGRRLPDGHPLRARAEQAAAPAAAPAAEQDETARDETARDETAEDGTHPAEAARSATRKLHENVHEIKGVVHRAEALDMSCRPGYVFGAVEGILEYLHVLEERLELLLGGAETDAAEET